MERIGPVEAQREWFALALAAGALALPLGGLLESYGFFAESSASSADLVAFAGGSVNVVGPVMLIAALALLVTGADSGHPARAWARNLIGIGGAVTCFVLLGAVAQALFADISGPLETGTVPGGATLGTADTLTARLPGTLFYGVGALMAGCTAWWSFALIPAPSDAAHEPEATDG